MHRVFDQSRKGLLSGASYFAGNLDTIGLVWCELSQIISWQTHFVLKSQYFEASSNLLSRWFFIPVYDSNCGTAARSILV